MRHTTHLFRHLVLAYQKHDLEKSYQKGLELHYLKGKLEKVEKRLKELRKSDKSKVELMEQRVDEIKHLFP